MNGPFAFGKKSTARRATLHPNLCLLVDELILYYDFSVDGGARTVEDQIENIWPKKVSKTIDSRHIPRDAEGNYDPNGLAIATDLTPYKKGISPWARPSDTPIVREKKKARFYFLQGALYAIARSAGIEIRQGIDWDRDADLFDQDFDDLPHVELVIPNWPRLRLPPDLLARANEALRKRGLPEYRNP